MRENRLNLSDSEQGANIGLVFERLNACLNGIKLSWEAEDRQLVKKQHILWNRKILYFYGFHYDYYIRPYSETDKLSH